MLNRTVRPHLNRKTLAAAAVAALGTALALPGASAQAATAPAAAGPAALLSGAQHPVAPGSFTFAGRDAKTGAPLAVTCTPNLVPPFRYYGGLYGGGVEALASLTCTQPIWEIQTVVALDRYTTQVAANSHTVYSTTTGSADTEAPLVYGQYYTLAQYTIVVAYGGAPVTSPVYKTITPVTLP